MQEETKNKNNHFEKSQGNPFITSQGKQVPQNVEAEKSLLGCLLIDPDAIYKVVDFLQPRDFYNPSHLHIFSSIIELFERKDPIDVLSLSSRLKERGHFESIGGASYLTELVNAVPTASHILTYAKIVQQKRILRDLIEASHDINGLAYQETEDVDELLDAAEKRIFSISQKSLSQQFTQVKDALEETFKRIDELSKQKGGLRGIPTGFRALDNMLAGLQRSDLVILAARPSLGKSSLAIDIARNVSSNYKIPVGIFSLEMSKDQIIDRLIASQADIDLWRLRTGRLSDQGPDNDFDRIQQAMGVLSEAPIYIDDMAGPNILQIRAMSRRLFADKGLGLLIIDYLQLMEARDPRANIVQQVSENSRALKILAKELNVPVLVLSQLSRAVEQRVPQIPRLSDLRESGCLTGDALIMRADTGERIKIKDLVGQTNIPVHSLDENWHIVESKMSQVFSTGKKMVYELKTRSGFSIKASANHPFWRVSGWTRLDELKVGDRIATPVTLKSLSPVNNLSDDEIIFLAHLLGDGCILPHQPYHYTSCDKENISIVKEKAKNLFNIDAKIVKQKNWWHVYFTSPYPLTHRTYHPITNWFNKLGLERVRSYNKQIPQSIFQLSNDKIALFLKHLWATDGHVGLRYYRKNDKLTKTFVGTLFYASTSYKMAEAVKHLLLRFGIRSKINPAPKGNYRICYQVTIDGAKHQLRFFEKIGCFGERGRQIPVIVNKLKTIRQNTNLDVWPKETWKFVIDPIRQEKGLTWREFSAGIDTSYCGSTLFKHGISTARMERIASFLKSETLNKMAKSQVFWDEIISIKPLGIEEVYDATVPGLHNFVANNIIVENSIEQDADVVMFIYREDRYKENTDRKGVADILIAKHRNGPVGKVELYFDEQRVTFRDLDKSGYTE